MEGLSTEVSFAQRLAGNTKKIRDRALKKLRNYMRTKSASKKGGFSKEDLLKLWKGLHYCLWMQDKAIVQEELSGTLCQLVHHLATMDAQLMFIRVFFITEAREWNSIDVWRLDKFMACVRTMLNESLVVLKKQKWQSDHVQRLAAIFSEEVMSPTSQTIPDGLKMHFSDIYLEELEKVGANQLTGAQLVQLLEPFIQYARLSKRVEPDETAPTGAVSSGSTLFANTPNRVTMRIVADTLIYGTPLANRVDPDETAPTGAVSSGSTLFANTSNHVTMSTDVVRRVLSRVFDPIVKRAVNLLKKRQATESEQTEDDDNEDIDIPYQDLKFDNGLLAERLFEVSKQPDMLSRNRPLLYRLVQKLQDVDSGVLPRQREVVIGPGITQQDITMATQELTKLEQQPAKMKKKKKKRRKSNTGDQGSDSEGKENDISDQNNNEDSLAVFDDREEEKDDDEEEEEKPNSKAGSSKKKRKLSMDAEQSKDTPVKKMKQMKKSVDGGLEKQKPLDKLKKLLKSRKENGKKGSSVTLTPVSCKEVKVKTKHPSSGAGWTVTPIKKGVDDDLDGNAMSESKNSASEHATMKKPPKLVLMDAVEAEIATAGSSSANKRPHSESSGSNASNTNKTDNKSNNSTPVTKTPVWTDEIQEGEVEIYVPSKKYKGKVDVTPKPGFASFDESKAPAAYVKKAAAKTPKNVLTPACLKSKTQSCDSSKRVSFDMKKNKAQAFKDSLKSPMTPYNPHKKPDQGILKTPEPGRTPSTPLATTSTAPADSRPKTRSIMTPSAQRLGATSSTTPTTLSSKPIKKAAPLKRPKAKDFFYL